MQYSSLVQELAHATGAAKKLADKLHMLWGQPKKKKKKKKRLPKSSSNWYLLGHIYGHKLRKGGVGDYQDAKLNSLGKQ